MKKFILSVFLAFLISKLTYISKVLNDGIRKDSFGGDFLPIISDSLKKIKVEQLKAYPLFNFGPGFEGTTHTANFVCTYSILIFLALILFQILFSSLLIKKII